MGNSKGLIRRSLSKNEASQRAGGNNVIVPWKNEKPSKWVIVLEVCIALIVVIVWGIHHNWFRLSR
jgi:hypothetical protein